MLASPSTAIPLAAALLMSSLSGPALGEEPLAPSPAGDPVATPGPAPDPAPPPTEPGALWLADPQPLQKSYWIPAAEILSQQLFLNLVARAARQDFAMISPASMWNNLSGPWWIDEDSFIVNQIGHPFQGAMYFTAARSTNLGFWQSAAYTALGSLVWEYLWETEPPSINDQITTTIGGILIGEAMHRLSLGNWQRYQRRPSAPLGIWSAVLDPMGTFNRRVLGFEPEDLVPPSVWASLGVGAGPFLTVDWLDERWRAFAQAQIAATVTYGLPGEAGFDPSAPFDHFDVRLELAVGPGEALGSMNTRALILGDGYGGERGHGIWGLYATQDFVNSGEVRAGAFGLGVGTSGQIRLGSQGFAMGTAVLSAVPIGAAGRRTGEGLRDYQIGPGAAQTLELRLGRVGTGALIATSQGVEILGLPLDGHSHVTLSTSFEGQLRVWRNHAVGVKLDWFTADLDGPSQSEQSLRTDASLQGLIVYSLLADGSFGASFARRR